MLAWLAANALALIAATGSTIAAVGTVLIIVASFRRKRPHARVELSPLEGRPGWYRGLLNVRNRADAPLRAETLSVARTSRARLLDAEAIRVPDGAGNQVVPPDFPVDKVARAISVRLHVGPAGTRPVKLFDGGPAIGGTDSHRFEFLLFRPASRRRATVSMRLRMRWDDQTARPLTITIRRIAIPHITPAK